MAEVKDTKIRIALIQFGCKENLTDTLKHLREIVAKTVAKYQPRIIALPECFTFLYETVPAVMIKAAEPIPDGETSRTLSELAKKFGVYILGGSIESEKNHLYNTCAVWAPSGKLVARHRKAHLCDIHFDSGVDIDEVSTLTPGDDATTFHVDGIKCGVAICHDGNFTEFIKIYGKLGCELMFIPAAYEQKIGFIWELNQRARALDNQMFVAAVSPAKNERANYVCYGHSMIVDPRGTILSEAGQSEEVVFAEIDLNTSRQIRREFPLYGSRRRDIYKKYEHL